MSHDMFILHSSHLAPPWTTWKSTEGINFLTQLKRWEEQNPSTDDTEMSVKGILEKIRKKVADFGDPVVNSNLAQDLLGMIPDTPFPVRSVVVGLIGVAVHAAVGL